MSEIIEQIHYPYFLVMHSAIDSTSERLSSWIYCWILLSAQFPQKVDNLAYKSTHAALNLVNSEKCLLQSIFCANIAREAGWTLGRLKP